MFCGIVYLRDKMDTIIINDDKIYDNDVNKFGSKVRAILVKDDKILVSHYGGVILLPGGSIDFGETPDEAIIRELREEIGIDYDIKELKKILILKYYQSNYQTRDNETVNRMITTQYFLGHYNSINLDKISRTEREIRDNFYLQLITMDELIQLLNKTGNNPRKEYFDRELKEVLKVLRLKR